MEKSQRALVKAWLACSVAVLAFLLTGSAFAEVVKNTSPPFQITMPDGFVARKEFNNENIVLTYRREGLTQRDVGVLIQVLRNKRMLPRDLSLSAEDLATLKAQMGSDVSVSEKLPWRGYDLPVIRTTKASGERQIVVFLALVPLAPEAIAVTIATETNDEASGRAVLTDLVASLEGNVGWRADERSYNIEGLAKDAFRLLVLVAIVGALVSAVRRRLRGQPAAATFYIPPAGSQAPGSSLAPRGMPSVAPGSVKCAKCGLVAFASAGSTCRRCGTPT